MGNRAVITASKSEHVEETYDIGVYLHWNGGRDSVEAFLKYCELQGFRPPSADCYGYAMLCQVIANFFSDGSGGLSVGVDSCCRLDCDNFDNGVYIIQGWKIVGRKFFSGFEQNEYDLFDFLLEIDKRQPEEMQLGEERIRAALGMECSE